VFKDEVDNCDYCGTKLVLIASINSSISCHRILNHLGHPVDEVNLIAPRGPPEIEYFDQMTEDF
jgi:hypothetical protein